MSYFLIQNRSKQSGFSLIEILISILILGVGILGLGGLQVASLKSTTNAHSRTIATMYATDLADRMRANPLAVQKGFYGNPINCSGSSQCRRDTYCSPEDVARFDLQEVMCGMKRGSKRESGVMKTLQNGTLVVTCDGPCNAIKATHNITITWGTTKTHQKQTVDIPLQSLVISVIP